MLEDRSEWPSDAAEESRYLALDRAQAFFAAYAAEAKKPHCAAHTREFITALLLRAEEAGLYVREP